MRIVNHAVRMLLHGPEDMILFQRGESYTLRTGIEILSRQTDWNHTILFAGSFIFSERNMR